MLYGTLPHFVCKTEQQLSEEVNSDCRADLSKIKRQFALLQQQNDERTRQLQGVITQHQTVVKMALAGLAHFEQQFHGGAS